MPSMNLVRGYLGSARLPQNFEMSRFGTLKEFFDRILKEKKQSDNLDKWDLLICLTFGEDDFFY